jgi:sulfide:quinone oxidoreductase
MSPQCAPDFIRVSHLADAAGWVDVDQGTMRHKAFANVYSLGDVSSTPNAKTAAAARRMDRFKRSHFLDELTGQVFLSQFDAYSTLSPKVASIS